MYPNLDFMQIFGKNYLDRKKEYQRQQAKEELQMAAGFERLPESEWMEGGDPFKQL